jgi:8-oxo-dGTP pyrophosphatase MutT (NUDIX family)
LEFPTGLVESDDLFENANRELKEETGYKADREIKLSV